MRPGEEVSQQIEGGYASKMKRRAFCKDFFQVFVFIRGCPHPLWRQDKSLCVHTIPCKPRAPIKLGEGIAHRDQTHTTGEQTQGASCYYDKKLHNCLRSRYQKHEGSRLHLSTFHRGEQVVGKQLVFILKDKHLSYEKQYLAVQNISNNNEFLKSSDENVHKEKASKTLFCLHTFDVSSIFSRAFMIAGTLKLDSGCDSCNSELKMSYYVKLKWRISRLLKQK